MQELLTTEELAERLRVSPHTIREWSRDGRIPTVWLSRTVRRFNFDAVLRAIRRESGDTLLADALNALKTGQRNLANEKVTALRQRFGVPLYLGIEPTDGTERGHDAK